MPLKTAIEGDKSFRLDLNRYLLTLGYDVWVLFSLYLLLEMTVNGTIFLEKDTLNKQTN